MCDFDRRAEMNTKTGQFCPVFPFNELIEASSDP